MARKPNKANIRAKERHAARKAKHAAKRRRKRGLVKKMATIVADMPDPID